MAMFLRPRDYVFAPLQIAVTRPYGHSDGIVKRGKTNTGQQHYRCQNAGCPHQWFQLNRDYVKLFPKSISRHWCLLMAKKRFDGQYKQVVFGCLLYHELGDRPQRVLRLCPKVSIRTTVQAYDKRGCQPVQSPLHN